MTKLNEKVSDESYSIEYEKKRKKRSTRMVILLVVLIIFMAAFTIGSSVWLYTAREKNEITKSAIGAAEIVVNEIDAEKVDSYAKFGDSIPGYSETEKLMYSIRDNTDNLQYLYVVRIQKDGCCFIFDLDTDDVSAYEPGTVVPFEEAFDPYMEDLFAGREIPPLESNDTFGWLVSVYRPVYDKTGKCVCYVCADISMDKVRTNITDFLMRVLIVTLFFLLLIVLVCIWLMRQYRKVVNKEEKMFKNRREGNMLRELVMAFVKTVDMKDKYTNGHSFRVAKYTAMLAEELGYDEETIESYYNTALMHDIGKIGIPDEVLNKPGKLTDEEFALIKSHTSLGYNVLKDISLQSDLADGARFHHERPDGKGYPLGLKGDEIPRVAQIIAVADTFDAMYSNRPYRKRMNFEKAVSIIKEVSGTQLTSDVVDAFLRLVDKGKFRAPDDTGGGSTEDINNIRKHFDKEETEEKTE